jgi:hypothetical protein
LLRKVAALSAARLVKALVARLVKASVARLVAWLVALMVAMWEEMLVAATEDELGPRSQQAGLMEVSAPLMVTMSEEALEAG